MRILLINTVCGTGSTGRITTDLYKAYEQDGHECLIGYGRGKAIKEYNTIKIGSHLDIYAHVAKTRIFDRHGFGSKKATENFIKEVEKFNPDIVHLHNIHGYYINIEILFDYLKEQDKKVIWTLHDCWTFTGHCAYFDYVGCSKWKGGCLNCPQKKEYPTSNILDNSQFNYKKKKEVFTGIKDMIIVTPSNWLAGLVKESFLKEYKVEVIHNGIDLEVFKPTESDFRQKYEVAQNTKIILGVASVWDRRKGLNYFVDLAKELDSNYQIVVVGVSEKQKKQLPENIISITRTNNLQELVEIYSEADVFFNPTLEDNFPTTNLEALACGTPVVTFDTGGSVECIDQNSGIVLSKKNKMKFIKQVLCENKYNKLDCIKRSKSFDKKIKFKEYNHI